MEPLQTKDIVQMVTVCISAIVAVVSLVISILGYMRQKPKLRIVITDPKEDCYYGWRKVFEDDSRYARVGYVRMSLVNCSPVTIGIEDINLNVKSSCLRRVRNDNEYWAETELYYLDNNGSMKSDGACIDYENEALRFPSRINAYDTVSGVVLFHNVPTQVKDKARGKIVLRTAIGTLTKRIRIREYNETLLDYMTRDAYDYFASIEEVS